MAYSIFHIKEKRETFKKKTFLTIHKKVGMIINHKISDQK